MAKKKAAKPAKKKAAKPVKKKAAKPAKKIILDNEPIKSTDGETVDCAPDESEY